MQLLYQDSGILRNGLFVPIKAVILADKTLPPPEKIVHLGECGDVGLEDNGAKVYKVAAEVIVRQERLVDEFSRHSRGEATAQSSRELKILAARLHFTDITVSDLTILREEAFDVVSRQIAQENYEPNLEEAKREIRALKVAKGHRKRLHETFMNECLGRTDEDTRAILDKHLYAAVAAHDLSSILPVIGAQMAISMELECGHFIGMRHSHLNFPTFHEEATHAVDQYLGPLMGQKRFSAAPVWAEAVLRLTVPEQKLLEESRTRRAKSSFAVYAAISGKVENIEILADVEVLWAQEMHKAGKRKSPAEAAAVADGIIAEKLPSLAAAHRAFREKRAELARGIRAEQSKEIPPTAMKSGDARIVGTNGERSKDVLSR